MPITLVICLTHLMGIILQFSVHKICILIIIFNQSSYTPRYTHEEYRNKFAIAVKFISILKKTDKACLFELTEGLGRWVPISSINSIENDTVWIYEQPYLAKPFKLETTNKETQQQEQITLETVNKKLDLIFYLLKNQ